MIKLVPFKECINKDVYNMYQDIPLRETGSRNPMYGLSYNEFLEMCNIIINEEKIINEKINTTTKRFILYNDNYPIGELGIRTTLNDFWCNKGSQIFYKLRITERGKGYGNKLLELGLIEAKKLGFNKIRINCSNDNIPSKSVILKNGGVIDIEGYESENNISSSYIIDLR